MQRLVLPEAFLAADVVLTLCINVADGMHVWPNVVRNHVMAELPFMATENILMACVKAGGDRQELHEAIRDHSMAAGAVVKGEGKPNDLLTRIANDAKFAAVHDNLDSLVDPSLFIGRCPEQVDDFMASMVQPVLTKYKFHLTVENKDDISV